MEFIEPIWEKQPKESIQAYEAFKTYRDLGSKRSLKLVCENVKKSHSCISQWSKRWEWVKRVNEYDNYLCRLELEEKENRIKEALNRHYDIAKLFQQKAAEVLKQLNAESFEKLNPLQLSKLFEITVNMEREALGIAPVVDEIRLHQAEARLQIHKQLMESKSGNDLADSSGFIEALNDISAEVWNDEK